MRETISIFVLIFLFSTIAFLSGFKSESTSSGCSSAPDVTIVRPTQDENIDNTPVSIEFTAIQDSVDLTAIDLNSVTAIIRDNMNKTIDITRYILSNCDILKKNCTFKGDVDLEAGEYILEVRVCNTTAACEMKEVRFTVFPVKPSDWISIISNFIKRFRCNASIFGNGCGSKDSDPDGDCILDTEGCDNCPGINNPDQADMDKDGIGDKCDDDIDGDGLLNDFEDRIGTKRDNPDSDNDGLIDSDELRFGTDPNNPDTNGDGIKDYDQIVAREECNSQGIVKNNFQFATRLPDDFQPIDEDDDGIFNVIDQEKCVANTVSEESIKYPLWVVKQEYYGENKEGLNHIYHKYRNGDNGEIRYLFDYNANIIDLKYGMIVNSQAYKLPDNLKVTYGDILTEIKARSDRSGKLESWQGSCRTKETEYYDTDTCCIDVNCKNTIPVNIVIKATCNIVRENTSDKIPWEQSVIQCDAKKGNIKCYNRFLMEDPSKTSELLGYTINYNYTCKCEGCNNCNLGVYDPCDPTTKTYAFNKTEKYELMTGSQLGWLWNGKEEIKYDYGSLKEPYSYSIPYSNFSLKEGFKIRRDITNKVKTNFYNSSYNQFKYDNFVEFWINDIWTPVRIKVPDEGQNNKFVYTDTSELIIGDLESSISGDNELTDYWKGYLRWDVDPIDDSHASSDYVKVKWDSYWNGDLKFGGGDKNKLSFIGMPRHNSDFGPKKLRFEMIDPAKNDPVVLDEREIKVFFPKQGRNHPYPPGTQSNTPNWYYYWGQDVPALETVKERRYVDEFYYIVDGIEYSMYWQPYFEGNNVVTIIYVYQSGGTSPYQESELSSYHWCTSKLAHENKHEDDFRNVVWNKNPYNPDEDQDHNFLRDSWENDPLNANIFKDCYTPEIRWKKCYRDWTEDNAQSTEDSYPDNSPTNDWAFPGSNY